MDFAMNETMILYVIISFSFIFNIILIEKIKSDKGINKYEDKSNVFRVDDSLYKNEMIELLSRIKKDYEEKIHVQKKYYESLILARKDRDDEYNFIVNRYNNEANLRKSIESKNRKLIDDINRANLRISMISKFNRNIKKRYKGCAIKLF